MNSTDESKYVQQHLANERTYLAWVRTSIAIVGVGFLAAGIVFRATPHGHVGHLLSAIAGVVAVLLGGAVAGLATLDYGRKRRGINEGAFRSATFPVLFVFVALAVIDVVLLVLMLILIEP